METDRDLLIFMLPVPVLLILKLEGPVTSFSCIGMISFILAWVRIIPHCTNRLPLWSGRELTVPLSPMERIFTASPGLTSEAFKGLAFSGFGVCFIDSLLFFSSICFLSF